MGKHPATSSGQVSGHPFFYAVFIPLMLLSAGSCRNETEQSVRGEVLTDDLSRQVTIRHPVQRVVSLAPSLTEMICAAGACARLVGVTSVDDFPPSIRDLPRFSILPLDQEAVLKLKPEIIFASEQINNPEDVKTFTAVGIPTYFIGSRKLAGILNGIRTIGRILNTETTANLKADSLEKSLALLKSKTSEQPRRPVVLLLISDQTLFAFGKESYVHELIAAAGGISATGTIQSEKPILTDEFVLKTNPDVIIGTFGKNYSTSNLLTYHPSWNTLSAIQKGKVFNIDESLIQRPGPRLVEAAWQIAAFLHPDVVPGSQGSTGVSKP